MIDFHAQWCGPCKMIAPQVEAMDKEMADVCFLKVDVDEAEDVAAEYSITAMPTFIFLKNGQPYDIGEIAAELHFSNGRASSPIVSLRAGSVTSNS